MAEVGVETLGRQVFSLQGRLKENECQLGVWGQSHCLRFWQALTPSFLMLFSLSRLLVIYPWTQDPYLNDAGFLCSFLKFIHLYSFLQSESVSSSVVSDSFRLLGL